MDDSEDDAGYPLNTYENSNHRQGYGSAHDGRLTFRCPPFCRPVSKESVGDYEEEEDIEVLEEEEGDEQINGGELAGTDTDDDEDDEDEGNDGKQKSYGNLNDGVDMERHPKKQKLKSLVSNYEFARRVPLPPAPVPVPSPPKPSSCGRNSLTDWTERETVVLLNAWGERFLQRGKKCLRSEEWQEVVEQVSEVSNIERTDTQCRNRLDTLKKKYKKEKMKFGGAGGVASKWVYFKKMDMLLSSPSQQSGLSCGLGSGEHVFMNRRAYLNRANGFDELRGSPGDFGSTDAEVDGSDGLPPKKRKSGRNTGGGSSFRLLAGSIKKFSEIYENIENIRRQQMAELEKTRMNFHRELEMHYKEILQRAQAEISKLQGEDDENDVSAGNGGG